jgi:undecaprenyl-diphosphatase
MSVWSSCPIDRHKWLQLVAGLVGAVAVLVVVGYLMTDMSAPNPITRFDADTADRLAASRTPVLDDLAHWGSFLADTEVKIVVTALFAAVAFAMWRRWHEPLFLAVTLIFEATVFIIVTTIVGRSRPDVPRLEDSPVDSSFPSGHVAAAAVYGAFVLIVFWHTRATWARAVAVVVYSCVVVAVAWARLYAGMHFLSDVVTGVVLGLWSVAFCLVVLGHPARSGRTSESGRLQGEHRSDPVAQQRIDDGEIPIECSVADQSVAGRLHRP